MNLDYIPNMLLYGPPGTGKTTTIINLIHAYQKKHDEESSGLMIHLNAKFRTKARSMSSCFSSLYSGTIIAETEACLHPTNGQDVHD
jgi:replication-associated recombination protein RarA